MSISVNAKTIGITLPNGKVKIIKAENPSDLHKELASSQEFYRRFPNVSESPDSPTEVRSLLLETING